MTAKPKCIALFQLLLAMHNILAFLKGKLI